MSIDPSLIGRRWGPFRYVVGEEKAREFAWAISGGVPSMGFFGTQPPDEMHPRLAAADSPRGLAIHPAFANVFAIAPFTQAVADPALGLDLLMLVHGEQAYEWLRPFRAGEVLHTTGTLAEAYSKSGKDFVIVTSETCDDTGAVVLRARWTAVIRTAVP